MPDLDPLHREVLRAFEEYRKAAAEFMSVGHDGPFGTQDGVLQIQQVAKANADALGKYIEALKRYNDAVVGNRKATGT